MYHVHVHVYVHVHLVWSNCRLVCRANCLHATSIRRHQIKWKLCVAVDRVVANRVVQDYVAAVLFAYAIESHCQNRDRTSMRCRLKLHRRSANPDADGSVANVNHLLLSMMCDIDLVVVTFDRSCEILSMVVPMWVISVECGLAIVLP